MRVDNDQGDRALAAFLDGPERRLVVPASPRPRRSPPAAPAALPGETGARIAALRERFDGAVTTGLRAVGMDDGRLPDGVRVEMSTIDGVPLVVAEPEAPSRAAVLHLHGGGWCLGSAVSLVPALARWALALRAPVASVEYRLAPEYPHPAAVDDCETAMLGWLQRLRAQRGIRRVALSGESAGAHLALLTLLRLRRHGIGDIAGACLSYGLYDFVGGLPSRTQGELAQLALFRSAYLGKQTAADSPEVSPLRLPLDQLRGLPPALFVVGTADALADDSVLMWDRWRQAGNDAWLASYDQAPHAFDLLPLPEARHANALRMAFLRRVLGT